MNEDNTRDTGSSNPNLEGDIPPQGAAAPIPPSREALSSADMKDLLKRSAADIQALARCDAVVIYTYDAIEILFSMRAHIGTTDGFEQDLQSIKISEDEYRKLLLWDNRTSTLEEMLAENTFSHIMKTVLRDGVNMLIVQPLLHRNSLLGMIFIGYHSPRKITAENSSLFQFIGSHTAASIDNIILGREIAKINKRLDLLSAINMFTGASFSLNRIFETIAHGIREILDFDHAGIAVIDGDKVVYSAAHSKTKSKITPGYELNQGSTPAGWLIQHNRLYVQNNLPKAAKFATDDIHLEEGMQSVAYIPMHSQNEVSGYMSVASRKANAFNAGEQSTLQEISAQIANRMEFQRLYTELSRHKEDLETTNKQLEEKAELLKKSKALLDSSFMDIAKTVVLLAESREHYTIGHSERVAELCRKIAAELSLSEDKIRQLESAARLLGLGKAGVPQEILNKPGPLNEEERVRLQEHQMKSLELLRTPDSLSGVVGILEAMHENFDGSGYPNQLQGNDIPLEARILAVADAYTAMISERPYRNAMSSEEAVKTLRGQAGRQWDPLIVTALLHMLK